MNERLLNRQEERRQPDHGHQKRKISHGSLRKPNAPDFELEELLTDGPLRKIEHALHRDKKRKLNGREQNLKLAARHHNFTPLENAVRTKIQSKYGFPSEQPAVDAVINIVLKKLAKGFSTQSAIGHDRHEKKRLARRLRSKDSLPKATQLRKEAKMPHHKAHKVVISINPDVPHDEVLRHEAEVLSKKIRRTRFASIPALKRQAEDLTKKRDILKGKVETLRRILFINPKVETLETAFMGNLVAKDGQIIKQLAHFITGASPKDMRISFYDQTDNKLTNRDVHLLIYQGLREILIASIRSPSGKVLLEITCSYPRWSAAHPGSLINLDGSWTDGQINFYHRQKKLERKQVEQILNRWLALSRG